MSQPASPSSPPAEAPEPRFLGVQARITLLLAATTVVFGGFLLLVQHSSQHQVDLLLGERVHESERVTRRILELRASGAQLHADDYTRWDDLVAFTKKVDPEWGRINITESIATFGVDFAWVLDDRFDLKFAANPTKNQTVGLSQISAERLAAALRERPIQHFFTWTPHALLEVWTSGIQPSDDFKRASPVRGYYIIGRLWTEERLKALARDASATVALMPPASVPAETDGISGSGVVTVSIPLPGIANAPAAIAVFRTTVPLVAQAHRTLNLSLLLIVLGVVFAVMTVGWALAQWVVGPLVTITQGLRQQDPALLRRTSKRTDELGRLARLVEEFFVQRDRLAEARVAADAASQAKSLFLANTSHELRTPMHGILSYARFGLREAMTADREELLEDFRNIEECGASLLELLNDLLDLAKFDAGRMKFDLGEVMLDELVAETMEEFAALSSDRALKVEVVVEQPLVTIQADRRKLAQVLRNLLSNAHKFTKPGGTVVIRVATSGALARVEVDDEGIGIPAGEAEMIFDKFVQASHTNARSGGTGLGLAICREIIEGHGGRIWAENREVGGARFAFEVPIDGPVIVEEEAVDEDMTEAPLVSGALKVLEPGGLVAVVRPAAA